MHTKKMIGGQLAGIVIGLLAVIPAWAQTTPQRTLLALSKTDHTLAIVDPTSLKVIARLPVGTDPHEVIASADGSRAYVPTCSVVSYHERVSW